MVEWHGMCVCKARERLGKDMGMGNPHGLWVWISMGMGMGWYQPTHEPMNPYP